jgi:hypothetical protein
MKEKRKSQPEEENKVDNKKIIIIPIIFIVVLILIIILHNCLPDNPTTTDKEFVMRFVVILLSLSSSLLFIILLWMLFSKSKLLKKIIPAKCYPGELDKIEPNINKLKDYFGKESFIYKEIIPQEKIKNGLLKTRRHFFKSFFYFFLFGSILYAILFYQTLDSWREYVEFDPIGGTCIINDTVQYGEYDKITIKTDSIFVEKGIFFLNVNNGDTTKISRQINNIEKYGWNKYVLDSIDFGTKVKLNDTVKNDTANIFGMQVKLNDTIKNDTACFLYDETITLMKDTLTVVIKQQQQYKNSVFFSTEEKQSYLLKQQDSSIFYVEKQIKKESKKEMWNDLPSRKKWTITVKDKKANKEKVIDSNFRLDFGNDVFDIQPYIENKIDVKKLSSFFINLLSMLTNVFLLVFFGLLNSKTDVFDNEKNAENYSWLKLCSIAIFILVCLVDVIITFIPNMNMPALHFAIETIIAIVSVIAVFGVWGSMNSTHINFQWWFKPVVFIYAAAQIFAVFLESADHTAEVMAIIMLFVAFFGKIFIMYKILHLVATKRLSWFFLNEANELRTNSYDVFVELFKD